MKKSLASLFSIFLAFSALIGCVGQDVETESLPIFPEFSAVADDGQTYERDSISGAFIAVFSAEWCSNPCHSSMHNIWEFQNGMEVYVFSTDPEDEPQGISLSEWHEAADGYDDEYNDDGEIEDEGVSLTTYKFMKGSELAAELDIRNPGTILFVNSANEITYTHKGVLDDQEVISEQWSIAN